MSTKTQTMKLPSVTHKDPTVVAQGLKPLATKFTGFEEGLRLAKAKKKEDNERRLQELQKQLDNLKTSLELESRNREMSMMAVQSWLNDRLEQWTDAVQIPIENRMDAISARVDSVDQSVDKLDADFAEDRKVFPALIDARAKALLREIKDFRISFEQNSKARAEQEQVLLVKIQNQDNKLKLQFENDKLINERKVSEVRRDLQDESDIRTKATERLNAKIVDDTTLLKNQLAVESKERAQAVGEILQAVNHYSAALQDGVNIVGL